MFPPSLHLAGRVTLTPAATTALAAQAPPVTASNSTDTVSPAYASCTHTADADCSVAADRSSGAAIFGRRTP